MPFWGIVVHTHVPWPGTPLPPLPQLRRPFHSCGVGWCTAAVGQRSAAQGGPQPAGHPHPPGRVSAKPQHVLRRVPALTPPLSWLMHPLFWVGVAGDMLMDGKSMTKVLKTVLQKVLGGGQTVRLSDSHWHRLELQHASTKQYKPHHPSQWTVAHKCFPEPCLKPRHHLIYCMFF